MPSTLAVWLGLPVRGAARSCGGLAVSSTLPAPRAGGHIQAPPQGSPWDDPLSSAPLAFVDLEMTGLDREHDHVVEVCVERWVGEERVLAVSSLVKPPDRAGGAASVHGLDAAALEEAPPFGAVAPRVQEALQGAVLVAHAAEWDVAFLEAEMDRAGIEVRFPWYLDTIVLARRAFSLQSYALTALATSLAISPRPAHRAEADVAALRAVFRRVVDELAPVSPRDLWQVRVAQGAARDAVVQSCEAAALRAQPVDVTYRPSRRAALTKTMVLTEVRRDADLTRVLGYELPGRGRRDLRADRILRVEVVDGPASRAAKGFPGK